MSSMTWLQEAYINLHKIKPWQDDQHRIHPEQIDAVLYGTVKSLCPALQCLYTVEASLPDLTKILRLADLLLQNPRYTVIRSVWVSAKFGTCTVVSVKGTPVEDKLCKFTIECTHFFFNLCPIYTYDGASAKYSTNSQVTDYSVVTHSIML